MNVIQNSLRGKLEETTTPNLQTKKGLHKKDIFKMQLPQPHKPHSSLLAPLKTLLFLIPKTSLDSSNKVSGPDQTSASILKGCIAELVSLLQKHFFKWSLPEPVHDGLCYSSTKTGKAPTQPCPNTHPYPCFSCELTAKERHSSQQPHQFLEADKDRPLQTF